MTEFKEKANFFNSFFAKQCSVIKNNNKLPFKFTCTTKTRLENVEFSSDDIGKIIQVLDMNKTHDHNKTNICMVKICGSSISKSLKIIYQECFNLGVFPLQWKKGNIVPIYRKGNKQYRYFLLVEKLWKKLSFDKMLEFFC